MSLWAGRAQPIPKIAGRILIKINDISDATVDREIACARRTDISHSSRRPTEQILRTKVVPRMAQARTKTEDLIHFVLSKTLRIEVARARRSAELIRRCRIKRNDSVVRAALSSGAVCEHVRWRVKSY